MVKIQCEKAEVKIVAVENGSEKALGEVGQC